MRRPEIGFFAHLGVCLEVVHEVVQQFGEHMLLDIPECMLSYTFDLFVPPFRAEAAHIRSKPFQAITNVPHVVHLRLREIRVEAQAQCMVVS